ncbi:hypothetical protein [Maribellus maritimus]|uniref:hypothetical protein n=1 Tax=Maribellus maritimus TaxID=2870838 RepID=UPI001EEBB3D1|nr:hypothetical protein [Maribellus maritimus]MCG6191029.1 hypothetical protein [Maribellus maritimus]
MQIQKKTIHVETAPVKKEKIKNERTERSIQNAQRKMRYQSQRLTFASKGSKLDTKSFLRGTFSVELVTGPVLQQTSYKYNFNTPQIDSIKINTSDLVGIKYGIRLNYHVFQVSFTTGIGISQYRENINNRILDAPTLDSLSAFNPKSNHVQLEILLVLGYHWKYPATDFRLQLGAINQFHLHSNGQTYTDSGTLDVVENVMNFTSYKLALYGGLTASFKLSEGVWIGAGAYYKYPLKKFASVQDMAIYKQSYGANITLNYHFQKR